MDHGGRRGRNRSRYMANGMPSADPIEIECYGPVARGLHWLIAGLAVIVVVLGWAMPEVPRETQSRDVLLTLHRSLGLTILLLMLFRIFWRLSHPVPPFPADFPRL